MLHVIHAWDFFENPSYMLVAVTILQACNNRKKRLVQLTSLSMREVWGSISGPVTSAQCRQRLATAATFLLSCVALALNRGDGPCHS